MGARRDAGARHHRRAGREPHRSRTSERHRRHHDLFARIGRRRGLASILRRAGDKAPARSSPFSTERVPGSPAATTAGAAVPDEEFLESGTFVSREKRIEFPSGENNGPISVPLALMSALIFCLADQPIAARRRSHPQSRRRGPCRRRSRERPYSSPGVLIAGPRFSADQWPAASLRARQMSLPPRPPGRFDPK